MDAEILEVGICDLVVHADAVVEAVARIRVRCPVVGSQDRWREMADALRRAAQDRDRASMSPARAMEADDE